MKFTPALASVVLATISALNSLNIDAATDDRSGPAQAAEQSSDASKSTEKIRVLTEDTRALVESLQGLQSDIERLDSDLAKAGDAEKSVLRDQRRRKSSELSELLQSLANNVGDLRQLGADPSEFGRAAAAFTDAVSRHLKAEIPETSERVSYLEERLRTATSEEAPELERQISDERTAVDEMLSALSANTKIAEALGIDRAEDLKTLENLLTQRADRLGAEMQLLLEQRKRTQQQFSGATEDGKKTLQSQVTKLNERIERVAANLKTTIGLLEERGLDTAKYKQQLIVSTGEITQDIFETEVALGLLNEWLERGKEWLETDAPRWIFKIVVFLFILLAFKLLANVARRIVRQGVSTSKLHFSQLLQNFFISFAGKFVFFIGILIALSQLGIELGPVLAGLGIAGFILGFALQDTLSNFASGLMILIYRPYDVGDSVEAGGVTGTVKQMNMVSTTIATWDNQKVVVPNKKIWGDVIRNITAEKIRRVDMTFSIGYDDDIKHAESVLREIVENHELVLHDPAPIIRLHALGESSVDFVVRPWTDTKNYWIVYWDITRAVKERFDAEGLTIPFPQQDMHVYQHLPEGISADNAKP